MSAILDRADPLSPRLNQAFIEYAQARGFVTDPARVRTPTDKPGVERLVPFTRSSMFAGESSTSRRLGVRERRCVPMAWTCCGGSVSCGRSGVASKGVRWRTRRCRRRRGRPARRRWQQGGRGVARRRSAQAPGQLAMRERAMRATQGRPSTRRRMAETMDVSARNTRPAAGSVVAWWTSSAWRWSARRCSP